MLTLRSQVTAILAVLTLWLAAGPAFAQGAAGDGREADHAALRTLLANATKAINNEDVETLASFFTKDFVFVAVDQSVLTSSAAMKAYYNRMLHEDGSPVTSFKMSPQADVPTRWIDADTGWCYGTSDDRYTLRRNGREVHMPSRWTATVVRQNGQWKVAAVHTGVNFMDNPVLAAQKISTIVLVAGNAGILLVLCLVPWRRLLRGPGAARKPV